MAVFDRLVMVDWSASATPKLGADSIWIATLDTATAELSCVNPPTRRLAFERLTSMLEQCSGRVLIGADFPMGPPLGLAALLADSPQADWSHIWELLTELITDDDNNANNRFSVAAELNRRIGQHRYWGTPPKTASEWLASTKPKGVVSSTPAEFRLVEQRLRVSRHRPFSWWQLYGAGSVGSQVVTGIPVMQRLRQHEALVGRVVVWPFETGIDLPLDRLAPDAIVIAEMWPSMLPVDRIMAVDHEVKDARQVIALARCVAAADAAGELVDWFTPRLTVAERDNVCREEGWVLGVSADGRPLTSKDS